MTTIRYNLDQARYAREEYHGTRTTKPNARHHSTIRVNDRTLRVLKTADNVAKALNHMMLKGNQAPDVFYTRLGSYDRTSACYRYRLDPLTSGLMVGNCDQFSEASGKVLSALNNARLLNSPITTVRKPGSHTFKVIGDPRDRATSSSNCAVVDAWPNYAAGHTLRENLFWREGSTETYSYTGITPPGFLNTNFSCMSTAQFEHEYMGGVKTREARAERFERKTDDFKEGRNMDFPIWNHHHVTKANTVFTYKDSSGNRATFDVDLTPNVRLQKEKINDSQHWYNRISQD